MTRRRPGRRAARPPQSIGAVLQGIGLVLAVVLGWAMLAAEPARAGAHLEPVPCRSTNNLTVDCGRMVITEDGDRPPAAARVSIPYNFIHGTGGSNRSPLIYINGGPGEPARFNPRGMSYWLGRTAGEPWLSGRDVLLFEQRGAGIAEPSLKCPEVSEAGARILTGNLDETGAKAAWQDAAVRCRARLDSAGIRIDRFTTADIADDAAQLMSLLGPGRHWQIYSVSFGTRVAQTLARRHPDQIERVILDSVYPTDVHAYDSAAANLRQAIASAAGPDAASVERDFDRVMEASAAGRVAITLPESAGAVAIRLDPAKMAEALLGRFYRAPEAETVPGLIHRLAAGDWDLLQPAIVQLLEDYSDDDFSYGLYFSVECHDEWPFNLLSQPNAAQAAAADGDLAPFARSNLPLSVCPVWHTSKAGLDFRAAGPITPQLLILSGTLDPLTPPAWAARLTKSNPNATVLPVTGVGHAVIANSGCARTAAQEFLDKGKPPLPQSCSRVGGDISTPVP